MESTGYEKQERFDINLSSKRWNAVAMFNLAAFCLAVVSWFTTSKGLVSYAFEKDPIAAYAISFAIQTMLFVCNLKLPAWFGIVRKWYLKGLLLLLFTLLLSASSFFSYVFFSELLYDNDLRQADAKFLMTQMFSEYRAEADKYIDDYLEASQIAAGEAVNSLLIKMTEASNSKASNEASNSKASNEASNSKASNEASNSEASNEASNSEASNEASNSEASNEASNSEASNEASNSEASNEASNSETVYVKNQIEALERRLSEYKNFYNNTLNNADITDDDNWAIQIDEAENAIDALNEQLHSLEQPTDELINVLLGDLLSHEIDDKKIERLSENLRKITEHVTSNANSNKFSVDDFQEIAEYTQMLNIAVENYVQLAEQKSEIEDLLDSGDVDVKTLTALGNIILKLPEISSLEKDEITDAMQEYNIHGTSRLINELVRANTMSGLPKSGLSQLEISINLLRPHMNLYPVLAWLSLGFAMLLDGAAMMAGIISYTIKKNSRKSINSLSQSLQNKPETHDEPATVQNEPESQNEPATV